MILRHQALNITFSSEEENFDQIQNHMANMINKVERFLKMNFENFVKEE